MSLSTRTVSHLAGLLRRPADLRTREPDRALREWMDRPASHRCLAAFFKARSRRGGPARRAGRPARAASGGRWTRTQHVVAAGHFGQARATGGTTPGKHRSHGLHFLVLTDEKGRLIWTSAARPGLGHDNTAARHDHILARLRTAGLGALADRPRQRHPRPVIVTGYTASRTHKLTSGAEKDKRILAVGRAPVAQGSVHLKNWRALTKLRSDPARATRLLRASLVLTNLEVNR